MLTKIILALVLFSSQAFAGYTGVDAAPVNASGGLTGIVPVSNGGTGFSSYSTGDLIYGNSSGGLSKLSSGANLYVLTMSGGGPTWLPSGVSGGGATVTSVALSAPSIFTVTGSPVTTAGTLALTSVSQAANYVWSGPIGGASSPPTFRALSDNDIPQVSLASGVKGTLSAVSGGTGLNTYAAGDIPYSNATNTLNKLAVGQSGQVLIASSTGLPEWSSYAQNIAIPALTSQSSNYTVKITDRTILANAGGSSFTATFPPAASVPYQEFIWRKTDTTMNVVSGAGGFTKNLLTPNETYLIQSDGSNYNILRHDTIYTWPAQPWTISNITGTLPVKGTVKNDKIVMTRRGHEAFFDMSYRQSAGGVNSGSPHIFDMLTQFGTRLDLGLMPDIDSSGSTGSIAVTSAQNQSDGGCNVTTSINADLTTAIMNPSAVSDASFKFCGNIFVTSTAMCWGQNNGLGNTVIRFSCKIKAPIAGWED